MAQTPQLETLTEDQGRYLMMASLGLWVAGCGVYVALSRRYRWGAFGDSPMRSGTLQMIDIVAGLCFWLGGGIVGASVASLAAGGMEEHWKELITRVGASAGGLLAVGYTLVRARQAVDGGLRGLGLRFDEMGMVLWKTAKVTVLLIPAILLIQMVVHLVLERMGQAPDQLAHELLQMMREFDGNAAWWVLGISAVLIAPVVEEVLYRGLIQTTLLQAFGEANRWPVVAGVSVLFALVHLGNVDQWYALLSLFVLGFGMGYAYEKTGRLWVPILIHAGFNLLNLLMAHGLVGSEVAG